MHATPLFVLAFFQYPFPPVQVAPSPPFSASQLYPSLLSQNPIQWIASMPQGIAFAQRTGRPLLFYIPPSRDLQGSVFGVNVSDEFGTFDSNIDDAQNIAFRDPIVRAFAQDRFVPVRLQRTNHTLPMLASAGLPTTYGMFLAAFTPRGDFIGWVSPSDVADPRILARRLSELYRDYRLSLFRTDLRPILENGAATPAELNAALRTISEFMILDADQEVISLLDRRNLDRSVRKQALDTLAVLSTPEAVNTLVSLAGRDRMAAEALNNLTLPAAAYMLSIVDVDDPRQVTAVYDAAAKITGIQNPKYSAFWRQADRSARERELARVQAVLKPQAQLWHEAIGVLR